MCGLMMIVRELDLNLIMQEMYIININQRLRTLYNKTRRKAVNKHKTHDGNRVCALSKNDLKQLWKELKIYYKKNHTTSEQLSADDFLLHFE